LAWSYSYPTEGSIILASDTSLYYTDIGSGPGLLFPAPVITLVQASPVLIYTLDTNSPQTVSTRTVQLQGFGPNGWYNLAPAVNEDQLPMQVNLSGLTFNGLRLLYTLSDGCTDSSENGTIVPPVDICDLPAAYSVQQVVDASQYGGILPPGTYLIGSNRFGLTNEWADQLGSIVHPDGTFTQLTSETQYVYDIQTTVFWNVVGGQPGPVFPPLTITEGVGSYTITSDYAQHSAAGNNNVVVEALVDGLWQVIWMGLEYDFPQTVPLYGAVTQTRATYILPGPCQYVVSGTVVNPTVIPVNIDCSQIYYQTYRYIGDPENVYSIQFNVPTGELAQLTFYQGEMACDGVFQPVIRAYSGTDDTGDPIPTLTGTFASLVGVTGTSTTNQLYLEIESPCDMDPDLQTWLFGIQCVTGAVPPTGYVLTQTKCDEYQFSVSVDVTFLGDSAAIGIQYSVDGGDPTVIPADAEGIYSIGSFPIGSEVTIILIHESDPLANTMLGIFTDDGSCIPANDPCAPAGAFKIDQAGDLADLPDPSPRDGWLFLVTSDTSGIGTYEIGEAIQDDSGTWVPFSSNPGVYYTTTPIQYWSTNGPGVQPYPLLPDMVLKPTGNNPINYLLSCPDITQYSIPTNQPIALEIRMGFGPWTQIWTGVLQATATPLPIAILPPFTNARMVFNYAECGLVGGVIIES